MTKPEATTAEPFELHIPWSVWPNSEGQFVVMDRLNFEVAVTKSEPVARLITSLPWLLSATKRVAEQIEDFPLDRRLPELRAALKVALDPENPPSETTLCAIFGIQTQEEAA